MATAKLIHIVGIGQGGLTDLTRSAQRLINQADLLIGEEQALALVPEKKNQQRFIVSTNLDDAVEQVGASVDKNVVVLAIGDPLFYGVARYLCDRLGKTRFMVVPNVSTMQLAFARVKESWEEAFLTNLAGHDVQSIIEQVRGAEKVGLFTSDQCPPANVARVLLDAGIDYFTGYVCENLGSPDERVTQGELNQLADQDFAPLNVMILVRKPSVPDRPVEAIGRRLFGNLDEQFLQSRPKRGLLTPSEIRSMALAEMDIGSGSIVWDVGAGSGSVAIEAAQIAREGRVFAIEMDPEDHQLIIKNAKRFDVINLEPILGMAPEAWKDLPDPDCIFIGGSGRGTSLLADTAYQRLRVGGRLVVTMGSINNVNETHQTLHKYCSNVKVWMVNLARGNYQMERVRFESINPIFMISVVKSE